MELAQENLERDFLRRWWCRKYRAPATDPRFLQSPELALLVEYVEDALEAGTLTLGPHGKPLRSYTLEDGTKVYETGDPEIDKLEQEFAAGAKRPPPQQQPPPPAAPPEGATGWYDEDDLLPESR